MDRETAFWNKTADKYSRRPVSDEAAYQKKLDATREYLQPDMEVLEIAKDKAKAAGIDNVTFEALSDDALDVPDASIDVVMAHSLLRLFPLVKVFSVGSQLGYVQPTIAIEPMNVKGNASTIVMR